MADVNFNLSTEKNSGNRVPKEGVDYIVVTDGNGGEIKLLNLENPELAPFEGIVELVPLKFAKGFGNAIRHQNEASFRCIRDKRTGWLIGIPLPGFQGKNREIQFERFTVRSAEFLDLSIPKDRLKWICIKNGPFLKGSPNFQSQSKTIYEAVDKERQATEFHANRRTKRKASEIAESLHGQELIDMAIALGLDPKILSTTQLEMEVIKFAENPNRENGKTGAERFLEIYNSDSRLELTILKRAISVGIVSENLNQGINYNGVSMGFTEFEALQFLKKSPQLLNSIDLQSKTRNDASTQAFATAPAPVKDEKDAVIERMKKEMAEMQARLAKTSEIAAEAVAANDVKAIDSELSDLIEEAKRLGIKAPHLIGRNDEEEVRKQKIRDKINEVNSTAKN